MLQNSEVDAKLDNDGFLTEMVSWNREMAEKLARRNDIGPLTDEHWQIIEYVRDYYIENKIGPSIVKIGKATGLSPKRICCLFECGVARGAYRLAGLPRPDGCV
jgi:tRNA 2-thiouridine synthesizing protein E